MAAVHSTHYVTARMEIRATFDAIRKESRLSKWKAHLQSRVMQRTILGFAEEKVRNISNKVAVENEVLNIDRYLMVAIFMSLTCSCAECV